MFENDKSLTNNGTFNAEAGSTITTSGSGGITNSGTLNVNEGSKITSGDTGKITNSANATITTKDATFDSTITNSGTITAESGNNTFNKAITNEKDATFTAKDGNVKIEQDLTNKGILNAEAGSSFSGAGKIANSGTDTNNKGKLDAKGAEFNVAVENHENGTITASGDNKFNGDITNAKGATITNSGNITIGEGKTLTNKGELNAEANSTISGAITNDGTDANDNGTLNAKGATFNGAVTNKENGKIITSGTDTNNFAGGVTNKGTFEAEQNSKISGNITNEKTLTAKGATFDSAIDNKAGGTITANTGTNTFNAKVDNAGKITAKDATFNGEVITGKTLTLEGSNTFNGAVTNNENGTITASGENTFNGDLVNKGTIEAEQGSKFLGTGTIQNEFTLKAKGATFENAITNSESGTITIESGDNTFNGNVSNSGTITANDASNIKGTGTITNESSGTITAKGATFENTIDNKGTITANAGSGNTNSFRDITTNDGSKIEVEGEGTTTFTKSFTNVSGATFTNSTTGNGKATLSEGLINEGTIINSANANIEISQDKILTNNGTLNAEASSKFTGNGTITNNGELNAKGATFSGKVTNESGTINVNGDNTFTGGVDNKGTLNAESGSALKGNGTITNESSGVINAKGATFEGEITNKGNIIADGANNFNKKVTTEANSTIEVKSGTATFKDTLENVADATLKNSGTISIEYGKKITNQGLLEAESGSTFSGAGEIHNEKTLNAKGATFGNAITNKGTITIESGENTFSKAIITNANSVIDIVSGKATFSENLENVDKATLKNSGTISIDSGKKITNQGLLEAESGSVFSGEGTIENAKTLNAKGATFGNAISNKGNGVITATGENAFNGKVTTETNSTITISNGKTTFAEDFENAEAKLINNGEVVFNGAFTNKAGTLTNEGTITFNGKADFKDKAGTNAVDFTNQSNSTLIFNDSAEFKGLTNQGGIININGESNTDGNPTKNFKAESITNYGTMNTNGGYIEATNFNNHSIFNVLGGTSTIKGGFTNNANANTYLQGTTLKVTGDFTNNGNLIFSFLGDTIGLVDASDTNAKFTNTDNKGKVQVDLSGSGKNVGEKTIIAGKDDDGDGTFENITLKESDVSFIGGSGKYLGNGKVLIDEVFANVPTGTINTPIIATNKANVASMNSMFLASNAIISGNMYNARYAKRMANRNDSRQTFALSALKTNESFYYDSKPLLLADARTSAQTQASGAQNAKDNFYFLLTPFVNHTSFKKSGDMSVSGLDYGFVAAFGGKVATDNTLGLHFVFDYAKLSDKNDTSFSATNTNLMVGLNYRLDLIYEMYFKARGDFYYFMNNANSNATGKATPNNLGGGVNVAFGKDFVDWKQAGVLGIELGLDYKALSTGKSSTEAIFGGSNDGIYDKALYHILYVDLGLNYHKYFSTNVGLWGFDAGLGARANLTPKVSSNKLLIGNRSIDISLDNDNFLGYVSVGGSYVLEAQNYDMEFTLRYNGSFGDKTISNGGSFEWRTKW